MKLRTFFWKTHRKVQGHQIQDFPILVPALVQDHGELKLVKRMKKKQISESYGVTMKEAPTIRQRKNLANQSLKNSGLVHTALEEFESFISTVRPTVHIEQSRKQSFSKPLFKPEEFEYADFLVWTENSLKTRLFENDNRAIFLEEFS